MVMFCVRRISGLAALVTRLAARRASQGTTPRPLECGMNARSSRPSVTDVAARGVQSRGVTRAVADDYKSGLIDDRGSSVEVDRHYRRAMHAELGEGMFA